MGEKEKVGKILKYKLLTKNKSCAIMEKMIKILSNKSKKFTKKEGTCR
ncbi:hypothetical protein [Diplocloster hominis]